MSQTLSSQAALTYDEVVREMMLAEGQYIRDLNMIIKVLHIYFLFNTFTVSQNTLKHICWRQLMAVAWKMSLNPSQCQCHMVFRKTLVITRSQQTKAVLSARSGTCQCSNRYSVVNNHQWGDLPLFWVKNSQMEEKRAGQATPCPHSSRSGSVSELQPITGFRNCLSGERACLNQDSLLLHFKRASKHCKKENLKH